MLQAAHRALAACLLIASSPLLAQQTATNPPALEAAHISATLYFPSDASELATRQSLHTRVAETVKRLPTASVPSLASDLDGAESLFVALQRHLAYLKVYALEDTKDQSAREAGNAVAADQATLEAAITSRLRAVPIGEIASLGRYAYLARVAQRDGAHALSPDVERYRGAVTGPTEASIADAYDRLIDGIATSKGRSSKDNATRRKALADRTQAYDQAAPTAAALLGSLVELEDRDAVAQGYPNAAERKYESLGLTSAIVDNTLAAVRSESSAFRQYQQLRAEHVAKKLAVPSALSDELDMVSAPATPISLPQARSMILSALQPLGPDYTQRFAQLLDPANGRLDLAGGAHRTDTGTSISVYDAPTALYYNGYDGSLRSVSTIIHEGGHAIHRELMNSAGIPVYERKGPHYLFESYAIFNELLLLEQATKTAATPAAREYALERLLSKISLELFVSAEETSFEKDLYTQASGHAMLDRPGVDAIFRNSIQPYEYLPLDDVGSSRNWMRKSLVFEDPLYLVNYLYASVIAVALLDKSQSDPAFAAKYESLLKRGFDADPRELLATMNIQLDDPHLVEAAARLFQSKTEELRSLYAANETSNTPSLNRP